MSEEDGRKISAFLQPGYTDSFRSLVAKNERKLETFSKFVQNLNQYTARNAEIIQQYETELTSVSEGLAKEHALLQQDVQALKKHVGVSVQAEGKYSPPVDSQESCCFYNSTPHEKSKLPSGARAPFTTIPKTVDEGGLPDEYF